MGYKLLNEQELRMKIENIIESITDDVSTKKCIALLDHIVPVIRSQQIAWADKVIGEDEMKEVTGPERLNALQSRDGLIMRAFARDSFRADLRERNKL